MWCAVFVPLDTARTETMLEVEERCLGSPHSMHLDDSGNHVTTLADLASLIGLSSMFMPTLKWSSAAVS